MFLGKMLDSHHAYLCPDVLISTSTCNAGNNPVMYQNPIKEGVERGVYRGIPVMRDKMILFPVKREFRKCFFMICDQ